MSERLFRETCPIVTNDSYIVKGEKVYGQEFATGVNSYNKRIRFSGIFTPRAPEKPPENIQKTFACSREI